MTDCKLNRFQAAIFVHTFVQCGNKRKAYLAVRQYNSNHGQEGAVTSKSVSSGGGAMYRTQAVQQELYLVRAIAEGLPLNEIEPYGVIVHSKGTRSRYRVTDRPIVEESWTYLDNEAADLEAHRYWWATLELPTMSEVYQYIRPHNTIDKNRGERRALKNLCKQAMELIERPRYQQAELDLALDIRAQSVEKYKERVELMEAVIERSTGKRYINNVVQLDDYRGRGKNIPVIFRDMRQGLRLVA